MKNWAREKLEAILQKHLPNLYERDPGGERNYDHINTLLSVLLQWREDYRCEHRVVPCSGIHDEGERVLICNTELTARTVRLLPPDRQMLEALCTKHGMTVKHGSEAFFSDMITWANGQMQFWCIHWIKIGGSWRCQIPNSDGQAMFAMEDIRYCCWCGAKRPD